METTAVRQFSASARTLGNQAREFSFRIEKQDAERFRVSVVARALGLTFPMGRFEAHVGASGLPTRFHQVEEPKVGLVKRPLARLLTALGLLPGLDDVPTLLMSVGDQLVTAPHSPADTTAHPMADDDPRMIEEDEAFFRRIIEEERAAHEAEALVAAQAGPDRTAEIDRLVVSVLEPVADTLASARGHTDPFDPPWDRKGQNFYDFYGQTNTDPQQD